MSCVNWNLRLWLASSVEMQCMPMLAKVHYSGECQRCKQLSPTTTTKSLTNLIYLQRLMKSGKDLMKMLPMSPSLWSATLRLKWLKGHRPSMNFSTRGGPSGFSVMSRSLGRLLITSSEQQVGTERFKVWKTKASALLLHCLKVVWKNQGNWHLDYGVPRLTWSHNK